MSRDLIRVVILTCEELKEFDATATRRDTKNPPIAHETIEDIEGQMNDIGKVQKIYRRMTPDDKGE